MLCYKVWLSCYKVCSSCYKVCYVIKYDCVIKYACAIKYAYHVIKYELQCAYEYVIQIVLENVYRVSERKHVMEKCVK